MDGYPVLQIVRCRLETEMEMDSQGYPFPMAAHSHSHLPHPANHAHFPRPHYPHPCDKHQIVNSPERLLLEPVHITRPNITTGYRLFLGEIQARLEMSCIGSSVSGMIVLT
nr:PREDICTED: uncharacterized protein LOC105677130 [Linepithema humile]